MAKPFTLFVDTTEPGHGWYRDYSTLTAALKAHSRAVKDPATARSLLKQYDVDAGPEDCKIIADWRRAGGPFDPDENDPPCSTCKGRGTVNPLTAPKNFLCLATTDCPRCDGTGLAP